MQSLICATIIIFSWKKKDAPASTYAAFNNERRSAESSTAAGATQPAQVQLSLPQSTASSSAYRDQDVTPSSGRVF